MRFSHQRTNTVLGILIFISMVGLARSQTSKSKEFEQGQIPVTTQWLLSSAKAEQRSRVHAVTNGVFLIRCSDRKGTGFLLKTGIVVTNEHVVGGCNVGAVSAESPLGKRITFSKMVGDKSRDLAILLPTERLQGGFGLSSKFDPPLETKVSTWGFPLTHSGPAPLLSVGYVAGYNSGDVSSPVKHIVVNGAFNPGNSGGPVFAEGSDEVVGVVVTKWTLFSPMHKSLSMACRQRLQKAGVTFT